MKYTNLIFALLYFVFNISNASAQSQPIVCSQKYVLCTSASCVPDPRHPDYAICFCDVEKGDSVGYTSCEKRAPKQVKYQVTQLISTFSFEQFSTKKSMTCTKGVPWTDCVDAPCTVNPTNPTKAICSCKIHQEQSFFTFGGACDLKQCEGNFWSGATVSAGAALRKSLLEKLKRGANTEMNSRCPTKDGT